MERRSRGETQAASSQQRRAPIRRDPTAAVRRECIVEGEGKSRSAGARAARPRSACAGCAPAASHQHCRRVGAQVRAGSKRSTPSSGGSRTRGGTGTTGATSSSRRTVRALQRDAPPPHSTAPQLSRPHLSSVDAQARSSRLPRDASGRETPSASGTQTRTGSTWSLAVRPPAVCTSCHLNRSLQPWHCFLRRASQVRASTSSRRRRTRRRCPATENRTTTRARRRGCSRKRLTHDSDE